MSQFQPRASDKGALGSLSPAKQNLLAGAIFHYTRQMVQNPRPAAHWTRSFMLDIHEDMLRLIIPSMAGVERKTAVTLAHFPDPPHWSGVPTHLQSLAGNARSIIEGAAKIGDPESKLEFVFGRAAEFHAKCVWLQPFEDGNKRWARMALSALLTDCGYYPGTYLSEDDRDHYMDGIIKSLDGAHDQLANLILAGHLELKEIYRSGSNF